MTMFASHAPGEVIDAIRPDLEAFTSLWSALRANYEGTNITRTVARLLHMYQPEEGVMAYERLLRTLFVLLEDFDSDGLQLLVSMVPPPKGVSDEVVKEVFYRATNFVRIDAPIFHKNTDHSLNCTGASGTPSIGASSTDPPYPRPRSQSHPPTAVQESDDVLSPGKSLTPEISKNLNPAEQNDNNGPINKLTESPQIISHESSEVFRGFPPSEIFNTQTHVQSIKNFYRPSAAMANYANSPAAQSANRNFVNFGQMVGQNSGQMQQPVAGPGIAGPVYRPKWFQSPYVIQKNSYPVNQYQDFYLKTANNQYVKVPASKVNNFHQASLSDSQASYEDYLRSRSNTVTSGLLEKIQRHHSLQEAAIKKILIGECDSSNNAAVLSRPRVPDSEMTNSQGNVECQVKSVDGENKSKYSALKTGGNLVTKSYCNLKDQRNGNTISSLMSNGDVKIGVRLDMNVKNQAVNSETFEEFAKEVRMRQRAIQEDIYKMDVVRSDVFAEEETDDPIKPEILEATEELRNSCKNFMNRSKTEESVEAPIFPKTRALSAVYEEPPIQQSNLWRLLTSKNVSGDKVTKTVTENSSEPEQLVVSPSEIIANKESAEISGSGIVQKRIIRRKKPDVSSSTRPKSQRVAQKGPITSHLANLQDDPNILIDRESSRLPKPDVTMKNNSQTEPMTRCPLTSGQQTTSTQIGPATTMAELAAYKKQYYDALLSIQRAKAAVANSLAISSVGNNQGFNPYYYNYLQHQRNQILQRRQHQLLMSHRGFSQRSMNPGTTPWFGGNDWRYPVVSQSFGLPQIPQMLRPTPSMWAPSVGYLGRDTSQIVSGPQSQLQQTNVAQVSKPVPMKRRKLEEIVGKLKETENNVNN